MSKTTEKVRYEYDRQGSMLSDGKNIYGYDSFNRVEQVATADGNIIRYIRGLGIICSDSESAKTYYHYASDEQSSITHVTDAETGEVLNHYTYDAFGNTMECDEKVHNRFRHNGEQYDPLTGQYYLRARFYNPVIARFTQEDTYYGDGLNLYQYCANNPIAYVDLSGHNICQTQRDVYHEKCEAYMRDHGLTDYSQIPKNEKNRMFKEMRTELGKTSDSRYKGSGTSPDFGGEFDSKWKTYLDDIEKQTGRKIPEKQRQKLLEELRRDSHTEKLTGDEYTQHRKVEWPSKKKSLIEEWEKQTGQKWPTYGPKDAAISGNKNRKNNRKYDAHEIIPNVYNSPMYWWNLHPVANGSEHQGGIHRSGAPFYDIFEKGD